MATRIQLEQLGYLDVAEDANIPLNFSIAEIQDQYFVQIEMLDSNPL